MIIVLRKTSFKTKREKHPQKNKSNNDFMKPRLKSRLTRFKTFFRVQHAYGKGSGTLSRKIKTS